MFADNLAAMLAAEPAEEPAPQESVVSTAAAATAGATAEAGSAPDEALPIDVLNLSSRAWSSLRQDGIQTLGDLTRRTEQQLRAIENIGPASLADIKSKLADRGLGLAEPSDKSSAPAPAVPADVNGSRPAVGRHAGPSESALDEGLAEVTPLRPARHESFGAPTTRERAAWQQPDNEAIDLLDVAGLPVLKRAVPAVAALIAVLLVLIGIRRRRTRRR